MAVAKTLRKRIEELERRLHHAQATIHVLNLEISREQLQRVSAQRGLTPYVYAIQALNAWLADQPELHNTIAPILKELGLYGVKVGYDPDRDLALSIISAERMSPAKTAL